jgi:hypothetical protein
MKFKDKYPNMIPVKDEQNGIILGLLEKECHICKGFTSYVHIHYEANFCSEECVEHMDCQYDGWLNQDPGTLE